MKQPPSVIAVANVLIGEARKKGNSITPLQLIKLAYIAHGFHLGFGHGRLFEEEIQAWRYGPVIPDLYQAVKKYKNSSITAAIPYDGPDLDEQRIELLEKVYEAYGKYTGSFLTCLTHQDGTPWKQVYNENERFTPIPDDLIKAYYEDFLARH